jgi:hypothetical protein
MNFVFNGIVNVTGEGDDMTLEFIHRDDAEQIKALGLEQDQLYGDCRIGMSSSDPGNFYCVDDGCERADGECQLRNSGSSYWCSCVVAA